VSAIQWSQTHYLLPKSLQNLAIEITCCCHFIIPGELITLLVVSTFFQQIKNLKFQFHKNIKKQYPQSSTHDHEDKESKKRKAVDNVGNAKKKVKNSH